SRPVPGRLIFRRAILLVACLLSLSARPVFGSSEDWFARVSQTDDGLPDNVITGLAQTPDGFLWIGTQGGLVRFDGTQFQEFSPTNIADVPNRVVRALIQDHQGALWIAIDHGTVISIEGDKARLFTERE